MTKSIAIYVIVRQLCLQQVKTNSKYRMIYFIEEHPQIYMNKLRHIVAISEKTCDRKMSILFDIEQQYLAQYFKVNCTHFRTIHK